jgi:hypothetical protein
VRLFLVVSALGVVACGGSPQGAADAGDASYGRKPIVEDASPPADDAAPPVDCDAGATPSTLYPAPHPKMPLATTAGGPVVTHPRFVPVVFAAEDRTADIGALTKAIAASSYWTSIVGQYGVGAASAVDPIVVQETPPASLDDVEVQTWLKDKLDGTHADFGAANASSIYVVYYPASTTVHTTSGDTCVDLYGYHSETSVSATKIVYGVIGRCTAGWSLGAITSHELFEAATDPYIASAQAWDGFDDPEQLTSFFTEIGDLCQAAGDVTPTDVGYEVARIWSNEAAVAGHDPCQPAPSTPYFRTVSPVEHVSLAPGSTTTIDLVAFSDGDTGGPWSIDLTSSYPRIGDKLQLALCRSRAQNGETVPLTITRPTTADEPSRVTIHSVLGDAGTAWTFDVGQ